MILVDLSLVSLVLVLLVLLVSGRFLVLDDLRSVVGESGGLGETSYVASRFLVLDDFETVVGKSRGLGETAVGEVV